METLINRTRNFASQTSTKFKLAIGHGGLTGTSARLPADTYVIFMSKPGHLLSQGAILSHPQIFKPSYLRNVITGVLPRWSISPTIFSTWTERVYGPGDMYPDLRIDFYDYTTTGVPTPGSPYNRVSGLHTLESNTRRNTHFKGSSGYLSNVIRFKGKGIYIVIACRASPERSSAGAMSTFRRNIRLSRGNQSTLRRIGRTDPLINIIAQIMENKQARMAKSKRKRSNNINPRPLKKSTGVFPRSFSFAPGTATVRKTSTRR